MNLLLVEPADFIADNRVRIAGDRLRHLREVLASEPGSILRVGLVGGLMGRGELICIDAYAAEIDLTLDQAPPPKLPLTLVLALPRPKMLRRVIRSIAELGIARLILINTWKVEKSYWSTPVLTPATLHTFLLDGLQQSRDTVLPELTLERRFKPFVEDRLPALVEGTRALVAHPGARPQSPIALNAPATLAIGPEGGFTEYEVMMLQQAGFEPVQIGPRILRVENAVLALTARLFT